MPITWNESVPSPSSAASSADDELRGFMVAVASGLSRSFVWPGSGGGSAASAGLSQFGNARLAIAGNSAVTGGYGDGFLLLNRNHISLHHIGSTWTALLGHSSMVDHKSGLGFTTASQVSARWVTQSGIFTIPSTDSFGAITVTFPTAYSATPTFVHCCPFYGNAVLFTNSSYAVHVSDITRGGFSAVYSGYSNRVTMSVAWESDGTVLL